MDEPPVVNPSPLIFLSKAGLLELLLLLNDEVLVPERVAVEIGARGGSDVTARAIENTPWLRVVQLPPPPTNILVWDLGPGESSVLAWGLANTGTVALL